MGESQMTSLGPPGLFFCCILGSSHGRGTIFGLLLRGDRTLSLPPHVITRLELYYRNSSRENRPQCEDVNISTPAGQLGEISTFRATIGGYPLPLLGRPSTGIGGGGLNHA